MNATRGTAGALLALLAAGCNNGTGPKTGALHVTVNHRGGSIVELGAVGRRG